MVFILPKKQYKNKNIYLFIITKIKQGLKLDVFVLLGPKFVGFMQVQFLTHQL